MHQRPFGSGSTFWTEALNHSGVHPVIIPEDTFIRVVGVAEKEVPAIGGNAGKPDVVQAKQDAIDAACNAYEDYGVKVFTVGFGGSKKPCQ